RCGKGYGTVGTRALTATAGGQRRIKTFTFLKPRPGFYAIAISTFACQCLRWKNLSHSARSAMCVAKSRRGDRQLLDAALIESDLVVPLTARNSQSHC